MNKKLVAIAVIFITIAVGVGIYFATKSSPEVASNEVSTEKKEEANLDLESVLVSLKSKYPTIEDTYIYTEERDPNGNLGKPGYYTSGAEFYDTRTKTPPTESAFGADSGGAIEVYSSAKEAEERVKYLESFQGEPLLDPGAAKQVNMVVVRASSKYTASQQTDMINFLASQVE